MLFSLQFSLYCWKNSAPLKKHYLIPGDVVPIKKALFARVAAFCTDTFVRRFTTSPLVILRSSNKPSTLLVTSSALTLGYRK